MKVLAHPASVDNVPTSAGKEDHVSMGMTTATKLRSIVENAEYVVAIELMAGAVGIDYRAPLKPGIGVQRAHETIRGLVAPLAEDRVLSTDIQKIASAIKSGAFDV
jgi:histidine ammonia-lyase